jgi:hypothetical protein
LYPIFAWNPINLLFALLCVQDTLSGYITGSQ